jgi:hypothetical protein
MHKGQPPPPEATGHTSEHDRFVRGNAKLKADLTSIEAEKVKVKMKP